MDADLRLGELFPPHSLDAWREAATRTLKGRPLDSLTTTLGGDLSIAGLHTRADAGGPDASGFPDLPPYTRGANVLDRRQAGWDIRQIHDVGSLDVVAARIAADVERGVRSLWIVPDPPARLGLSGPPRHGEATGIAVQDVAGLTELLAGVDLVSTPVAIEGRGAPLAWFATFVAMARERGIDPQVITGAIHADPFATLARDGIVPGGLDHHWDELASIVGWSRTHAPWIQVVDIDTTVWADCGAAPQVELGLGLAAGVEALRQLTARGLVLSDVCPRVIVRTSLARDPFVQISKLRALRTAWARMAGACGAGAACQKVFLHAVTSRAEMTAVDPWVNLLRATSQAFGGAVGGADAVTVVPFDREVGVSSEAGLRVASNLQVVLEEESHLGRVADPAGGSWYVEQLTHDLGRAAWAVLQQVEAAGGLGEALVSGAVHRMIEPERARRDAAISRRQRPVLGVSRFPEVGPPLEREQVEVRWTAVAHGDASSLAEWEDDGRVAAAVAAAQSGADVLALAAAGRADRAPLTREPMPRWRASAGWEALRRAGDLAAPQVTLVGLGPLPAHKGRVAWARQAFEAAGFVVSVTEPCLDVAAVAAAIGEAGVCLCGSDATYGAMLLDSLAALGRPPFVALAGRPVDPGAVAEAGVTHVMYEGVDLLALLAELQTAAGVA